MALKGCCSGLAVSPKVLGHVPGCACDVCQGNCGFGNPDLCETITSTDLTPAITVTSEWNIPACGANVTIYVDPTYPIAPNAILWHPDYGYFQIANISGVPGQLVVTNICYSQVSVPGKPVPACTKFLQVANPFVFSLASGVAFLASNFTAPSLNNCVTILVTNISGFIPGITIRIGSATYYVSAVDIDAFSLIICNTGNGFDPGENIVAVNSFGTYVYPITIASNQLTLQLSVSASKLTTLPLVSGNFPSTVLVTPNQTLINSFATDILIYGDVVGVSYGDVQVTGVDGTQLAQFRVVTGINVTDLDGAQPSPDPSADSFIVEDFIKQPNSENQIGYFGRCQKHAFQFVIPAGEGRIIYASNETIAGLVFTAFSGTVTIPQTLEINLIGVFA